MPDESDEMHIMWDFFSKIIADISPEWHVFYLILMCFHHVLWFRYVLLSVYMCHSVMCSEI